MQQSGIELPNSCAAFRGTWGFQQKSTQKRSVGCTGRKGWPDPPRDSMDLDIAISNAAHVCSARRAASPAPIPAHWPPPSRSRPPRRRGVSEPNQRIAAGEGSGLMRGGRQPGELIGATGEGALVASEGVGVGAPSAEATSSRRWGGLEWRAMLFARLSAGPAGYAAFSSAMSQSGLRRATGQCWTITRWTGLA